MWCFHACRHDIYGKISIWTSTKIRSLSCHFENFCYSKISSQHWQMKPTCYFQFSERFKWRNFRPKIVAPSSITGKIHSLEFPQFNHPRISASLAFDFFLYKLTLNSCKFSFFLTSFCFVLHWSSLEFYYEFFLCG